MLLPTLGGMGDDALSDATAVAPDGDVVGDTYTRSGDEHAVLWRAGRAIDVGARAGCGRSEAAVVDDEGDVAGRTLTDTGQRAFLWRRGRATDLGPAPKPRGGAPNVIVNAINDLAEIVGSAETEFFGQVTSERAFRSVRGRRALLAPPQRDSAAVDVSDADVVVGYHTLSTGASRACLRGARTFPLEEQDADRALGTLGGDESGALALDDRGRSSGGARCATAGRTPSSGRTGA